MSAPDADRPGEDAPAETGLRIEVPRGNPTAEELAAAVAVVSESYRSEAAGAVADERARRTAWQVTARALRGPLRRDVGWGRFGG